MSAPWTRRHWLAALSALAAFGRPARADRVGHDPGPVRWPSRLETVDGQPIDTAAWRDQPAVVVFWATWCGYCRRHNAHVDKLYRSLEGRRLTVLGVAIDGDAATVQPYLLAQRIGFPVVLDGGRLRAQFTERRMVPMTCVLDREGRVTQLIPGEMAEADVLALARLALPPSR